jgi:hypothetical protein
MHSETPFHEYFPVEWKPKSSAKDILSVKRNHGVHTSYVLHNEFDDINIGKSPLERVLIEYQVNGLRTPISHDLYTFGNLFRSRHDVNGAGKVNITGELAERVARRVTKYFLQHYSDDGKIGELFRSDFSKRKHDEYIVANTDEYILKIINYPNMVLLRKTGTGKFGYEPIAELDGLFDYRHRGRQNIMVLESKLNIIDSKPEKLVTQLFSPLRKLFPKADMWYVLFAGRDNIYKGPARWHQLNDKPQLIYRRLKEEGVQSLYFTFPESRADFDRMTHHIATQYRLANNMHVTLHDRTILSDNEIIIHDGGQRPIMWLQKDPQTGSWKETSVQE